MHPHQWPGGAAAPIGDFREGSIYSADASTSMGSTRYPNHVVSGIVKEQRLKDEHGRSIARRAASVWRPYGVESHGPRSAAFASRRARA